MKIVKLFLFLLIFIVACTEEKPEIKNEGEITLSSEFLGSDNYYYRMGYSFEKSKFFAIPVLNSNEVPDVFLEDIPLPGSEDLEAFIYTVSGNVNGILKNAEFNNLYDAEGFYNEYVTIIDGPWESLSDTLKKFQVYTFKTSLNHFVKLLILDVRVFNNLTVPDYMEVDLKYYIKRESGDSFLNE
ncbi:MAG: hypothetical protein K9H49_14630 [Bacteroidales bacterium]|nr:hypothetical protein [Bacteroidales bacterium]MCF8390536.1 hypothetical protein [Bacteroidales bacterium]